jgi:hypothetical protein
MAQSWDLRNIPRSDTGKIAVGERGENVTLQEVIGHSTSQNVTLVPVHIREKIWRFVSLAGKSVSRGEIAKGLGIKKTGWLHTHIETLVSEGWLIRTHSVRPNGSIMFWYEVSK